MSDSVYDIYSRLREHFGLLPDWWPIFGDDPAFEKLLGAVLVQQTRWEEVEHAVMRLRAEGLLSSAALAHGRVDDLAALLKPVAFYRQKAGGIIAICDYLERRYAGSTAALLAQSTAPLRRELLTLPRIGPETADVVLLYAGEHPVFVVDEYTRRLLGRVAPRSIASNASDGTGFEWARTRYDVVQAHITRELAASSPDAHDSSATRQLYADYHALINEQCVRYCVARRPRCDGPPARRVYSVQQGRDSYLDRHDGCPLRAVCAYYQEHSGTKVLERNR
jgi:endonuclease-3 related protein